jgi:monovalent cation:proton antiporter-2 (CPA2) family protein
MSLDAFLVDAFVYLLAAVVAVPLAQRLGLGSVLGYLLAGAVIGPFGLGLVGAEGEDVMHFAEFGVVMMLFVIGLELNPALLWRMRGPIVGIGGLQVGITTAAVAALGMVFGLPWQQAVAVGMVAALSSTAIVLQTLAEKGLLQTSGGQSAFSVLLFQDIAVIPMLAILPLLTLGDGLESGDDHGGAEGVADAASGTAQAAADAAHHAETWISGLSPIAQTGVVLLAVAGIIVGGRYLLSPVFRELGRARMREVFTAAALLLVIGIALLMMRLGLSPALGTFTAGVVLASSEYRHELEADVEPFKGLLLGIFFIAVGASIDFALIAGDPVTVFGLTLGIMTLKLAILLGLARAFRMGPDQGFLFAFSLAEMGEFGFVLLSFASQEGVLTSGQVDPLVAAVALSMTLTPLLLLFNDRVIRPRVGTKETSDREADEIDRQCQVIIAGFGGFGSTVGRLLRGKGIEATVLDHDSDQVDLLRSMGLTVFYGDSTRHDLMETAGAGTAQWLVVAVDTPERTRAVVEMAQKHFPQLKIMARAWDWGDANELLEMGVEHVYRHQLDTALRAGSDLLNHLGFPAYQAFRASRTFLRHDEESLRHLRESRREGHSVFVDTARQRIEDLETMLRRGVQASEIDESGWDTDSLRKEFSEMTGVRKAGPPPGDEGELPEDLQVVARGEQVTFHTLIPAELAVADVREQGVAEALPAHRIGLVAILLDVGLHRLGRAAEVDPARLGAVRGPEVAQVADPGSVLVDLRVGQTVLRLDHLEGEARGRRSSVGSNLQRTVPALLHDLPADHRIDPRLVAEREEGADLDPGSALALDLLQGSGATGTSGHPEGQAEPGQLGQVHLVPFPVLGLALLVEDPLAPGWGVVTACGRGLDDEAVDGTVGLPGQHHGQGVGGDDGQELGSFQHAREPLPESGGIELQPGRLAPLLALHVQPDRCRQVLGEPVEHAGNVLGNPGAHEDVVHTGHHGPVERRQVGHLDLGEKVDAHHAVVPLLGQPHLAEVRQYRHFVGELLDHVPVHGQDRVLFVFGPSLGVEEPVQGLLRDFRDGKRLQGTPHVTARVAVG